jgi:hypothetical protein
MRAQQLTRLSHQLNWPATRIPACLAPKDLCSLAAVQLLLRALYLTYSGSVLDLIAIASHGRKPRCLLSPPGDRKTHTRLGDERVRSAP